VKKSCLKSPNQAYEEDFHEIESLPGFGLFNLGFNRDINERSPLFQEPSKVKVTLNINFVINLWIVFLEF
jgi:hypothetical protein